MDPLEIKPGSKVFHALFGTGTVRAIAGSGASAKITVDFGSTVGSKTLLAGSAPLRPVEEGSTAGQHWCECLTVTCNLRRGRQQPVLDAVRAEIQARAAIPAFWAAVRDVLRAAHSPAPKVLDDPSGCISISLRGRFEIEIRVKHAEPLRPEALVLARAIFDVLAQQALTDCDRFSFKTEVIAGGLLAEPDCVVVCDDALQLADRAPRRRPLPVRPKGMITNMPRRRDDY